MVFAIILYMFFAVVITLSVISGIWWPFLAIVVTMTLSLLSGWEQRS